MADELNIPTHRWYEPRNNISLPNSDFSRQWIYDSGIQKIDRWINSQPWGNPINALFALNEPGVWFDPSDLTTLFTDPAGTTPVTAPGQTVGLMLDKSKGLALGAELVANGDFSTASDWTLGTGASISGGVLAYAGGTSGTTTQPTVNQSGKTYIVTFTIVSRSAGAVRVRFGANSDGALQTAPGTFTLYTKSLSNNSDILVETNGAFVGTIDNISVRELAGNHATQATLAARPVYGIEPVGGRRNLLTWTEQFDTPFVASTGWEKTSATALGTTVTISAGGRLAQYFARSPQADYVAKVIASGTGTIVFGIMTGGYATIALQTITLTSTPTAYTIAGSLAGGATLVGLTFSSSAGATATLSATQLELGSTATAYQRVTTQHDVTEAGVASVSYLYFDGASDNMVTSTITPGVDKAQVFAGVRKLSDVTVALLLETSANSNTNDGTLWLAMPISAGVASNSFRSKGTSVSEAYSTTPALTSAVVTGLGDISGDRATIRTNGVQSGQNTGNQGTGNYLAYPLYIGARGGSSLPFSGHIYSLITRFGPNLDAPTIASTEVWVAGKTGFYTPIITGVPTIGVS